ncbi:hypothetical protein KDAU_67450 [Dictyobacter aurantiacus]|uniref:Uncharacterized protein n=1 Tax=Dictyobacter aurantiacus TaxID=1936993 RepID=A0A401ZRI8_9CHLR|nr:hypothetical protein KDAU_67450 [Dictyobacter aurantiacus]
MEMEPTEPIEHSSKVVNDPFRDVEARSAEDSPMNGDVLAKVSESVPGHIVSNAVFAVPLSYGRKRRKKHIYVEEPARRSEMRRKEWPLAARGWVRFAHL